MATTSVEQLVDEAIEAFDDETASVSGHVRRAVRIASKRQDFIGLIEFIPEALDFTGGRVDHAVMTEARENLTALLGKTKADEQYFAAILRYMTRRRISADPGSDVQAGSIGHLESMLAELEEQHRSFQTVPTNLTPIDTYLVLKENDKNIAKLLQPRTSLKQAIQRVKDAVYGFLVETEHQLRSGQQRPTVFDRGREYIEQSLTQRAPEALAVFRSAEEALERGGPEDLAHALTSCRRMIKAMADAVYPASNEVITGADGRDRKMDDSSYQNRLLQFAVEELGKSTHTDLLQETFRSLGMRLKRLNALASKGVHGEVSRSEAETCIMWTYLTAGDILRIADGTSIDSQSAENPDKAPRP